MSDEYVYTVQDVIRPDLTPEARAELCCVVWQTSDTDHIEYVIAEAIRAAATQAQAAAERAEAEAKAEFDIATGYHRKWQAAARERDEACASLTACSEAGIQVTRQKIVYRNRALALLHRTRAQRIGNRVTLRVMGQLRADDAKAFWIRLDAAEARAASLEALLNRAAPIVRNEDYNDSPLSVEIDAALSPAAAPGDETEKR